MTIMFAGGMTIAAPSVMPDAFAAGASSASGLVSVSSEKIQGAAILEIVIDDPAISAIDTAIGKPTLTYSGGATTTLTPYQASDGKWYAYIVDDASANTATAITDGGLSFGIDCTGASEALTLKDGNGVEMPTSGALDLFWMGGDFDCSDPDGPDNANNALIAAGTAGASNNGNISSRSACQVLCDPPEPNRNSSANGGGQIAAVVNATSGNSNGLLPFVHQVTLASDNLITYGGETVAFEWGNMNSDISISIEPDTYANGADINIIISDNGLNIDPTDLDKWVFETLGTAGSETIKRSFGNETTASGSSLTTLPTIGFGSASTLVATGDTGSFCTTIATFEETADASGVFVTPDGNGASDCDTSATATNHHTATYSYGGESDTVHIAYNSASLSMDAGDAWLPAEAATVTLVDSDANRVNNYDETLGMNVLNAATTIPYIKTGSPVYLGVGPNQSQFPVVCNTAFVAGNCNSAAADNGHANNNTATNNFVNVSITDSSATTGNTNAGVVMSGGGEAGIIEVTTASATTASATHIVAISSDYPLGLLTNLTGTVVANYDVSSIFDALNASSMTIDWQVNGTATATQHDGFAPNAGFRANYTGLTSGAGALTFDCCEGANGMQKLTTGAAGSPVMGIFTITSPSTSTVAAGVYPLAMDFFSFNATTDVASAIYRLEAEEDGTDGTFTGTVDYATMVHEGNSTNATSVITTNSDEISLLLATDMTGGAAPRVLYGDQDESNTQDIIGTQLDANTHTGTVSFDGTSFGTDSIVHVTVTDADLNQDSGARESYSQQSTVTHDSTSGDSFSVSYNDVIRPISNMKLVETGDDTGVFIGQFKTSSDNDDVGKDVKFTYYDRKDAGGTSIDTYASVTLSTESGSISFDRAVYPVPFFAGWLTDGSGESLNNPHAASPTPTAGTVHGNVTVYFTVTDGDYTSEQIADTADIVYIKLNGNVIATGGAASADLTSGETGPLTELERGTSVYEGSLSLDQFETVYDGTTGACIVAACTTFNVTSGMVLQAAYQDAADSAGVATTYYDSATVDLRTGAISTDKEVYVIGSDFIVTLTDPDLNLDSDSTESYSTSLVEWDSAADSSELLSVAATFAANPSVFRETGSNTGVFQTVFTFPSTVSNAIEQGEEVTLTYRDQGLSGKDQVKDDYSDIETTIYASNFGAIIELDKAIYDWTDLVVITVTAPDHNKDSEKEESIGTTDLPVKVSTRQETMPSGSTSYTLRETGEDTGVFYGEYTLRGFADSNLIASLADTTSSTGNTDGTIKTAGQTDGITVSYEYTDGSVSLASALIAWNIGEISFSDSSVSPGGSTIVTIVDADLDINDTVIDTKTASVWSDSDSGGISITLHETAKDSGVFETAIFFTADDKSTGSLLRVSEGDTVTVEYTDQSLPEPYETTDTLTLAATTTVGTVYPPLERAPASNARVVDAFGSQVSEVSADQQVQIAADVSNGTGKDQSFAYLVQVQDASGVTVSLAWITGSLTSGQSMSPALSWTPSSSGSYTATVFVWQSVDNPTALSPTVSVNIDVV
jgi:hypothetical protein